jgi:hypothetical protein
VALTQFDATAFLAQLQRLGEPFQRKVQARIETAAARTAQRTTADYPVGPTGNLRAGVSWGTGTARPGGGVMYGTSGVLGAYVRSRAPHAWLYEHGTTTRRNYTRKNALRGRMPARAVLIRVAPDERQLLYADLADLLAQEGR